MKTVTQLERKILVQILNSEHSADGFGLCGYIYHDSNDMKKTRGALSSLIKKGIKFCSNKCKFNYYNIKVTCTLCRVPFYRKRYQIIQRYYDLRGYKHIYCSRQCFYRGQRAGISSKKNLI